MLEATLRSPKRQQRILRIRLLCFKVARAPLYKSPARVRNFTCLGGAALAFGSRSRIPADRSQLLLLVVKSVQLYFNIAVPVKLMTLEESQAVTRPEDFRA